MMENSDSDTFDTLVFDALVSEGADNNSIAQLMAAEVLVSENKHLDIFHAQMQMLMLSDLSYAKPFFDGRPCSSCWPFLIPQQNLLCSKLQY